MFRRHSRLSFPHSIHFLTTVTNARGSWFIEPPSCKDILEVFERARTDLGPLRIAYVLVRDHWPVLLLRDPDFDEVDSSHVKTHAAGAKA